MLLLSEARKLLEVDYFDVETGYGLTSDNMAHIAASTYMPGVTAAMIDWWFGFVHTTEQYKLWHPTDHVFSDWEGPRENKSQYIGGHHLVKEYIGGKLSILKISFKSPAEYFGPSWEESFKKFNYGTAVCGRVGSWDPETGDVKYTGHLIHLVKNEEHGCRMRSRFWLGDVQGSNENHGDKVPQFMTAGLMKHATEEMAILASKLPSLYVRFRRDLAPSGQAPKI